METIRTAKGETKSVTKPLSERLRQLLIRLKAAYPMLVMEQGTADEYKKALTDMAGEFSIERTERAVDAAIRACKFFPTVKELRDLVPPENGMKAQVDADCEFCRGSGWEPDEGNRVKRCRCRKVVAA